MKKLLMTLLMSLLLTTGCTVLSDSQAATLDRALGLPVPKGASYCPDLIAKALSSSSVEVHGAWDCLSADSQQNLVKVADITPELQGRKKDDIFFAAAKYNKFTYANKCAGVVDTTPFGYKGYHIYGYKVIPASASTQDVFLWELVKDLDGKVYGFQYQTACPATVLG